MMKKGFGLVEILVVMVILLIVGAGVFFAYRNIVGEAVVRSLVAKQEQDVNSLVFQLKKDIASIGFGIDRSRLRQYGTNGVIGCNSLAGFAGSNSLIARCEQDTNSEELYFLSLAGRQENLAGCWWFVDASGNVSTNSKNNRLQNCEQQSPSGKKCLILDIYKNLRYYGNCPTGSFANYPNTFVFAHNSNQYPKDYAFRYYTDNANLPRECAPNTFNLYKWANGDAQGQPIISCVGAFRVRFCDGTSCSPTITNINNLRAVRLCLLLQVGGRTTTQMDVPLFFSRLWRSVGNLNTEWRWYRWALIEETIPLENIR